MEDREYKRVDETTVGPYWVSTVWLGLDHRFAGEGPPIIFETMIFQTDQDGLGHGLDDQRYCTEAEAKAGHLEMVKRAQSWLDESSPERG